MGQKRESFIVYLSFYEALKELREKEAYSVFEAMCEYCFYGREPELTGMAKAVFTLIKPQLDANNRRYENGLKGGRPKKQPQSSGWEEQASTAYKTEKPNEKEKEKENASQNGKEFDRLKTLLLHYEGKK